MQQQKTFAWARKGAWRWIWEGIRLRIRFRLHMPDEVRALFTSQTACIVLHSFCCCCCCIINATAKQRVGCCSSVQSMQIRRKHPSTPPPTPLFGLGSICLATFTICARVRKLAAFPMASAWHFIASFPQHCDEGVVLCVHVCVPQMSIIYKMPAGTFAPYPKHISMRVAADSKLQRFRFDHFAPARRASPSHCYKFGNSEVHTHTQAHKHSTLLLTHTR